MLTAVKAPENADRHPLPIRRIGVVADCEASWGPARQVLEDHGFAPLALHPDTPLRSSLQRDRLDAVIVDWDITSRPAVGVLDQVRAAPGPRPFVMVAAASSDEADVALALAHGADDYLTKPLSGLLLLARLRMALAAAPRPVAPTEADLGPYAIDRTHRCVTVHGQPAPLTAREFDLACLLFENLGRPLSRADVLETLWGYRSGVTTRTLDTHMSRVRTKLALVPDNGASLSSIYGFGYQLDLRLAG